VGRRLRALALAASAAAGVAVGRELGADGEPATLRVTDTVTVTLAPTAEPATESRIPGYYQPSLARLVPDGADLLESWTLAGTQGDASSVAVSWGSTLQEGSYRLRGVSVWQRHSRGRDVWWSQDARRRLHAYAIDGTTRDLTGDGRHELLLREERAGRAPARRGRADDTAAS
jgi:hypothetical protein